MKNIPQFLIVHHAGGSDANPLQDSSNFTFDQCNELHKQRFNFISSLGFYVGYHYYIEKNGAVKQARADDEEGAHCIGYNTKSLGICLAGNFDVTSPTADQIDSLTNLLQSKLEQYSIPLDNIVPHRAFSKKTCYGSLLSEDWARKLVTPPIDKNKEVADKLKEIEEDVKDIKDILNI